MLTLFLSSPCLADSQKEEIDHLLQYVGNSDVIFIRNGQEHTPAEAMEHLTLKRNYFKNRINSAEDFIRLCATKSLISGDLYMVRLKDGQVEEVNKWLMDELIRYRQKDKGKT